MKEDEQVVWELDPSTLTECWPDQPNKNAQYHDAGVLNADETVLTCPSCGGEWAI